MDVTVWVLLGAVGTVCSILFGLLGYQKGVKKEAYTDGGFNAGLKSDIDYIKRRTDEVLLEQKDTNKSVNALAERVTRVEESSKQAHKRINRLEKGDSSE